MPMRVKYICAHCGHGIYGDYDIRTMGIGAIVHYHLEPDRDCKAAALEQERKDRERAEQEDWVAERGYE